MQTNNFVYFAEMYPQRMILYVSEACLMLSVMTNLFSHGNRTVTHLKCEVGTSGRK